MEVIAPTIRRICCRVLGAAHSDLEDSIQESLFASTKALRSYRFDGDIHHYVTKIALRIAIAARRSSAKRWHRHGSLETLQVADASTPVVETWSADEMDFFRRTLDCLSRVQREALMLRVVWGFTVEEIATSTGVSRNTAKTRLRLGKNTLRKSPRARSLLRSWLSERCHDADIARAFRGLDGHALRRIGEPASESSDSWWF